VAAWLLKTEPKSYGFDDLLRAGRTRWDGITNPVALRNLRAAKIGDVVVIYHTGEEKAAVGLARVARAAYPDPEAADERLAVIDIAADRRLKAPVPLAALKASQLFAGSPLVRQGRLSVVPLDDAQLRELLRLAGDPADPARSA
jgi:predicted RNA-binding protein with PUA-like domain